MVWKATNPGSADGIPATPPLALRLAQKNLERGLRQSSEALRH